MSKEIVTMTVEKWMEAHPDMTELVLNHYRQELLEKLEKLNEETELFWGDGFERVKEILKEE